MSKRSTLVVVSLLCSFALAAPASAKVTPEQKCAAAKMQVVGKKIVPVPLFVLGDKLPHRNAVEDDVPAAMGWLELISRFGFLRRNDNWSKMYERFVDDCGRDGVWHPHKGLAIPRSSAAWIWSAYPLESPHGGDERWADMTFRIGLIARLSGRPVKLI